MSRFVVTVGALVALAVTTPALAQANKTNAPSSTKLQTRGLGNPSSANPVSLVDDASLLGAGNASLGVTALRWQGAGVSEVQAPIAAAAVGVTSRLQFAMSAPYVVGSTNPAGSAGGLGTVYFTGKVGVFSNKNLGLKVALSPTVEVLGAGAVGVNESRAQLGLPVSLEVEHGLGRVYAGAGAFTNGSLFAGVGAAFHVAPRVVVSMSYSRAWITASSTGTGSDRHDVSGGVSLALASAVAVSGSIGHSIATLDANGAGTTLTAGLSLFLSPSRLH